MATWFIVKAEKDTRLQEEHHARSLDDLVPEMQRLAAQGYNVVVTQYADDVPTVRTVRGAEAE